VNLQENWSNLTIGQFCTPCVVKFAINYKRGILRPIMCRMKDNTLYINLKQVLYSSDDYMIFSEFIYKSLEFVRLIRY
jgi:hypothetical protein